MPMKTGKRMPAPAAAPAEKKARQDPLLAGVNDALRQAKDLPETCRAMLKLALPSCLNTPLADRHEHQVTMVSWMAEIMDGVRSELQDTLDKADKVENAAAATKQGMDDKVEAAKAVLGRKDEAVTAKEAALKEAKEATVAASEALGKAKEAQVSGDARHVEAGKEKAALEKALEVHVKALQEDEAFRADQAEQHLAVLMPIAKRLELDDSLVAALPAVSARTPSTRGSFDCMVLAQLQTSLQGQVTKLSTELEAGAPAATERAAAVEAAQAALLLAKETEQGVQTALADACSQQREATTALSEARAVVEAFVSGRTAEAADREEKAVALQNFVGYNMECFSTLRDKVAEAGA